MVPRVHVHLSPPGINSLRLAQFGLKLVTAGALALTISLWWVGITLHDKIDTVAQQTRMISTETAQIVAQAEAKGLDLSEHAIQNIPQHISFVKQVRERVGFSWTQLLTDLEAAVPEGLMMSTVSLDEKTNTVLLNGSTQTLQDLNQLIHQLEKHHAFHDVILTQHAKKKNKNVKGLTHQPFIIFSMKVSYIPNHQHSKPVKS